MPPDSLDQLSGIGTIGMGVYVILEILKRAGFPSRYAGLLGIVLGILLGGVAAQMNDGFWLNGAISGFWGAASASGVYSGSKALFTGSSSSGPQVTGDDEEDYISPIGC